MSTRKLQMMCRSGFPDIIEIQAIIGKPEDGVMVTTQNALMGHPHQLILAVHDVRDIRDFLSNYLDEHDSTPRVDPLKGTVQENRKGSVE